MYAFLDDLLKVTKESLELHKKTIKTILQRLDEKTQQSHTINVSLQLKKVEWLGYNINSEHWGH